MDIKEIVDVKVDNIKTRISKDKEIKKAEKRKYKKRHKHDFGKKIVDYAQIIWFMLFFFVCFITVWTKKLDALIAFIYSSAAVFGIVFGFSIWKAKSEIMGGIADKRNITITNVKDVTPSELDNSFYSDTVNQVGGMLGGVTSASEEQLFE